MSDGTAEIFDCGSCERPEAHCEMCPFHDQPGRLKEAESYLKLYSRMKRWDELPEAGGILDQDDSLMNKMDRIDMVFKSREQEPEDGQR